MLNEGRHIEGLDGEIMLRPTESPIVYKQQIGRALTAAKDADETVIVDGVNNWLRQLDAFQELEGAIRAGGERKGKKKKSYSYDLFKLSGEELELLDILKDIGEELRYNTKGAYEEILEWLETHDGKMPRAIIKVNGKQLKVGEITEDEKNDVLYYLAIRSYLLKLRVRTGAVSIAEMNEYVKNLLADAIKGDEVKVLTKQQDDSINVIELLSKEKIEELRKKNPPLIFVQIIKKLLERAIAESRKNNYFKSQEYSKKLRRILEQYNDRDERFVAETTIVQLVDFAGELVSDEKEANKLGISGRERAFYDALVRDKSAQELLNDETLKLIAHELKDIVETYAITTDWSIKQATRAQMRIKIKECLRKYGYPPEYREEATSDVIKQAEYMMNED